MQKTVLHTWSRSVFLCCDENKCCNLKIVLEDLFSIQIEICIHIKC